MEQQTVVVIRELETTPEHAFFAFTDPAELAAWWWPQLPGTVYDVDPVVDGVFEIRNDAVGIGIRGRYLVVEPPSRLSFTWQWLADGRPDGPEDQVDVAFSPGPRGTTVTVEHSTRSSSADNWRQGWSDCLDRLAGRRPHPLVE